MKYIQYQGEFHIVDTGYDFAKHAMIVSDRTELPRACVRCGGVGGIVREVYTDRSGLCFAFWECREHHAMSKVRDRISLIAVVIELLLLGVTIVGLIKYRSSPLPYIVMIVFIVVCASVTLVVSDHASFRVKHINHGGVTALEISDVPGVELWFRMKSVEQLPTNTEHT